MAYQTIEFNSHRPEQATSPGRRYDIMDPRGVAFNTVGCGILGGFFTIGNVFKWFGLLEINRTLGFLREDVVFFVIGLAILWFGIYTLRQVYRLHILDSGALELKTGLRTATVMPSDIRFIRTGRRFIWWEGGDARVIHITHDRGKVSLPNFDGAEALFTTLISMYPNIRAGKLDFQPDIRD